MADTTTKDEAQARSPISDTFETEVISLSSESSDHEAEYVKVEVKGEDAKKEEEMKAEETKTKDAKIEIVQKEDIRAEEMIPDTDEESKSYVRGYNDAIKDSASDLESQGEQASSSSTATGSRSHSTSEFPTRALSIDPPVMVQPEASSSSASEKGKDKEFETGDAIRMKSFETIRKNSSWYLPTRTMLGGVPRFPSTGNFNMPQPGLPSLRSLVPGNPFAGVVMAFPQVMLGGNGTSESIDELHQDEAEEEASEQEEVDQYLASILATSYRRNYYCLRHAMFSGENSRHQLLQMAQILVDIDIQVKEEFSRESQESYFAQLMAAGSRQALVSAKVDEFLDSELGTPLDLLTQLHMFLEMEILEDGQEQDTSFVAALGQTYFHNFLRLKNAILDGITSQAEMLEMAQVLIDIDNRAIEELSREEQEEYIAHLIPAGLPQWRIDATVAMFNRGVFIAAKERRSLLAQLKQFFLATGYRRPGLIERAAVHQVPLHLSPLTQGMHPRDSIAEGFRAHIQQQAAAMQAQVQQQMANTQRHLAKFEALRQQQRGQTLAAVGERPLTAEGLDRKESYNRLLSQWL